MQFLGLSFFVLVSVCVALPFDLTHLGPKLFGEPDLQLGERLAEFENDDANPDELGNYAESDLLIPTGMMRNALVSESYRWPGGRVPYVFNGNFNKNQLEMLDRAMKRYLETTCIRFVPKIDSDVNYLSIENSPSGCWSSVGMVGGKQVINLQTICFNKFGTVVHELMHSLGFMHEQNRHERDNFVAVQWDNIYPGKGSNFFKAAIGLEDGYGVPYDVESVMHYSPLAFSKNQLPTILPRFPPAAFRMGQREDFSELDIEKINRVYNCPRTMG